jgi:hypothetical protein
MSYTSDSRREKREWEHPPIHMQNDGSGLETFPDIANSTYQEEVSNRTCSEDNRVHLGIPRSATSSRNRAGHSLLWQHLFSKHQEVLDGRKNLREVRAALETKQKEIDEAEAQLLRDMTAAMTDFSFPRMKDVVDGFVVSQTSRQALRSELDALQQQEERLNSNEEALANLERNAFAEILSPIDFPGGFLDFSRNVDPDAVSVISVPTETSPAKERYDRSLRAVNVIRERLLDMQSENKQLLREQETRKKLGRTLDAFSLQTLQDFDANFASTTRELDQAQTEFVIAEATWTNRRKTLEREEEDSETPQRVTSQESANINSEDFYGSYKYEDAHESLDFAAEGDDRASAIASKLFQTEAEPRLVYDLPSKAANGDIVNQARFISQWLLQQIHQSPAEARRFAKLLAKEMPSLDPQFLVDNAISNWTQDGTENEFIANVKKRVHSRAQSLSRTPSGQFSPSENDSIQPPIL